MKLGALMFDNDFPLLSTPSLMALILRKAETGAVTLEGCERALAALFAQAREHPGLPPETIRRRLNQHIQDLAIARLIEADGSAEYVLTDRGRDAIAQHPGGVDWSDLVAYPEFSAHLKATAHHPAGMDPRIRSYDEGYTAQRNGHPFTANPYTLNTVDHSAWENGWMRALDDIEKA